MHPLISAFLLIVCMIMPNTRVISQSVSGRFTTVVEDRFPLHYLQINANESRAMLSVPHQNYQDMPRAEFPLSYTVDGKILKITPLSMTDTTDNAILKRIVEAEFQIKEDGTLYDVHSKYTYVSDAAARKFIGYITYIVDGVVYQAKNAKIRNGLIIEDYKLSKELKKQFESKRSSDFLLHVYHGREAYDKFGMLGMNGVFEFTKKK
jgi:hypothetical protein